MYYSYRPFTPYKKSKQFIKRLTGVTHDRRNLQSDWTRIWARSGPLDREPLTFVLTVRELLRVGLSPFWKLQTLGYNICANEVK